jgi:hypothetical protein
VNVIALLVLLLSPVPCQSWDLKDDASLVCDGQAYPLGSYVLEHAKDDGDIFGVSVYCHPGDAICHERAVYYHECWDLPEHLRVIR